MSLTRNPAETDPLMTQSQRGDFPRELEGQVVDGGVREGRPESAHVNDLVWLFVLVVAVLVIVGVAVNWGRLFP